MPSRKKDGSSNILKMKKNQSIIQSEDFRRKQKAKNKYRKVNLRQKGQGTFSALIRATVCGILDPGDEYAKTGTKNWQKAESIM